MAAPLARPRARMTRMGTKFAWASLLPERTSPHRAGSTCSPLRGWFRAGPSSTAFRQKRQRRAHCRVLPSWSACHSRGHGVPVRCAPW
eukprot:588692-Prymnesium_polylepis.2